MSYDGRLLAGLTVLMAVVEAGSMTRAAEALGLRRRELAGPSRGWRNALASACFTAPPDRLS